MHRSEREAQATEIKRCTARTPSVPKPNRTDLVLPIMGVLLITHELTASPNIVMPRPFMKAATYSAHDMLKGAWLTSVSFAMLLAPSLGTVDPRIHHVEEKYRYRYVACSAIAHEHSAVGI